MNVGQKFRVSGKDRFFLEIDPEIKNRNLRMTVLIIYFIWDALYSVRFQSSYFLILWLIESIWHRLWLIDNDSLFLLESCFVINIKYGQYEIPTISAKSLAFTSRIQFRRNCSNFDKKSQKNRMSKSKCKKK